MAEQHTNPSLRPKRAPQNRKLLEAVAPQSWERPVSPPHASLPDPIGALKANLANTIARDMLRVGMPEERIPAIQRGVLAALRLVLDAEDISLSDQTAACLIALRVALGVATALRFSAPDIDPDGCDDAAPGGVPGLTQD